MRRGRTDVREERPPGLLPLAPETPASVAEGGGHTSLKGVPTRTREMSYEGKQVCFRT